MKMHYQNIVRGKFVDRPNRFIAKVEINGIVETVHVKNTGRCKELLVPGASVFLERAGDLANKAKNPRKTKYDLVSVIKERDGLQPIFINMDSQAPNIAAANWIEAVVNELGSESQNYVVRTEVTYGNSRFDLCVEQYDAGQQDKEKIVKKTFIEVKGVTLEENGVAFFPDAPTQRGVKHIKELEKCVSDGHEAYILFVIQMTGVHAFRPNEKMHKEFAEALRHAAKAGVKIIARSCIVTNDSMKIDKKIDVLLYKNILMDLDDTIFDFKKAEYQALAETLNKYGIAADEKVIQRYSEINISQWKLLEKGEISRAELKWRRFKLLFDELKKDFSAEEVAEYYTYRLSKGSFFLDGALAILEELYKKYNLYIVSNGFAKTQHGRISAGNLKRFFKDIFISQEIGADKPAKEFFDTVFSRIPDFDRDETIIVGDSLSSDIKGGKNAKIDTIWLNRKNEVPPSDLKPDFEIKTISELTKIL